MFIGLYFSNYRSSKKVDSSGRPVKGRGFMVVQTLKSRKDHLYCLFRDIRERAVRDHVHHRIGAQLYRIVDVSQI